MELELRRGGAKQPARSLSLLELKDVSMRSIILQLLELAGMSAIHSTNME